MLSLGLLAARPILFALNGVAVGSERPNFQPLLTKLNAALAKTCWVHFVHTAHLPKSAVQHD